MRRVVHAGIILFAASLAGVGARAADLAPVYKAPPVVRPAPVYDWSGFYVGVNLGVINGDGNVDQNLGTPFPAFNNVAATIFTPAQLGAFPGTSGNDVSVIGGGQLGYNWQIGSWVYGFEADIDGTGLRENSAATLARTTLSGTQTATANYSASVDWIATLRARYGYTFDRTMVYGTAGVALAGTRLDTAYAIVQPAPVPTPGAASDSGLAVGWTAGIGAEWAYRPDLTFGAEYRHTEFQRSFNTGFADVALVPFVGPNVTTVHFVNDQFTVRANWRPWH